MNAREPEASEQQTRRASENGSVARQPEGYSPHEHRPLRTYAALSGVFVGATAAALLALRASGRALPERIAASDVVLIGVATHKLSRLITKDKATSFLRAPFTRFEGSSGHGEVQEQPRGEGLRLVAGELLVCPFCLAQWVSGAFAIGLVAAPRLTRLIASAYAALALSDVLQLAYRAAEEQV